jgi:hypothetical protein
MQKYNKLLSTIFSILFVIIFSIYNFDEYKNFHQNKVILGSKQLEVTKNLEKFKLEGIKELKDVQFYYTPNKYLISKITNKIESAKKEIYLEIYMLTEKRIQESLIRAYKK